MYQVNGGLAIYGERNIFPPGWLYTAFEWLGRVFLLAGFNLHLSLWRLLPREKTSCFTLFEVIYSEDYMIIVSPLLEGRSGI